MVKGWIMQPATLRTRSPHRGPRATHCAQPSFQPHQQEARDRPRDQHHAQRSLSSRRQSASRMASPQAYPGRLRPPRPLDSSLHHRGAAHHVHPVKQRPTAIANPLGDNAQDRIASEEAQDMLSNILIAALADDPRFAAFVPSWYSQATDDSSSVGTATSQPFDNLCEILRNFARLMTSRTIQMRAARRESNDQPRSELAYRGDLAYYGAQRNRRSPSPSSNSSISSDSSRSSNSSNNSNSSSSSSSSCRASGRL